MEEDIPMQTTQKTANANSPPLHSLDLDSISSELRSLARATVDKTLQQARATGIDPVLGCSSPLATFYMMMPRNDGAAQEQILEIVARHADGLAVVTSGLKFGIDQKHLDLIPANDPVTLAGLQTNYDPDPRGPTYRPDALLINKSTGKACLLEFKRQTATVEITNLNRIADSLTIARAQVRDFLYQKHKRIVIDPAVTWAIIDCSDQELPPRFRETGVFGLDSLDAICGVKNVAAAYRLARDFMAAECRRGETELIAESRRFVPAQAVDQMIEAAISQARSSQASHVLPTVTGLARDPEDDESEADVDDEDSRIIRFPPHDRKRPRRFGMFGA
tara:strand:+ start:7724 stop:8725 length:1002 start_codon:yes stop_codon:yes gene_type:complete